MYSIGVSGYVGRMELWEGMTGFQGSSPLTSCETYEHPLPPEDCLYVHKVKYIRL